MFTTRPSILVDGRALPTELETTTKMNAHAATVKRYQRGYVVTLDHVKVDGRQLSGGDRTREGAILAVKQKLAAHLNVDVNRVILIISGDK